MRSGDRHRAWSSQSVISVFVQVFLQERSKTNLGNKLKVKNGVWNHQFREERGPKIVNVRCFGGPEASLGPHGWPRSIFRRFPGNLLTPLDVPFSTLGVFFFFLGGSGP